MGNYSQSSDGLKSWLSLDGLISHRGELWPCVVRCHRFTGPVTRNSEQYQVWIETGAERVDVQRRVWRQRIAARGGVP